MVKKSLLVPTTLMRALFPVEILRFISSEDGTQSTVIQFDGNKDRRSVNLICANAICVYDYEEHECLFALRKKVMANKKPITAAFTSMASRYEEAVDTELNGFWGWRYAEFISTLLEKADFRAEDVVLDVATGTGLIPERLVKKGYSSFPVHGMDITMEMLLHARRRFTNQGLLDRFAMVCGNAMQMPYKNESFTYLVCGLATHHMSVPQLLQESFRILQKGGRLSVADAGAAPSWRVPGAKLLLRLAAFLYFSLSDNFARAWIEAGAVTNVRTKDEWFDLLSKTGFADISIIVLRSKHNWISAPLCIRAVKSGGGSS